MKSNFQDKEDSGGDEAWGRDATGGTWWEHEEDTTGWGATGRLVVSTVEATVEATVDSTVDSTVEEEGGTVENMGKNAVCSGALARDSGGNFTVSISYQ